MIIAIVRTCVVDIEMSFACCLQLLLLPLWLLVGHLFITTQNICKYWDKTFALTT